jgi:hypothetical protein
MAIVPTISFLNPLQADLEPFHIYVKSGKRWQYLCSDAGGDVRLSCDILETRAHTLFLSFDTLYTL